MIEVAGGRKGCYLVFCEFDDYEGAKVFFGLRGVHRAGDGLLGV